MKNIPIKTPDINTHWSLPLLGLMTAWFWFNGVITSGWWWLAIILLTATGYVKKPGSRKTNG